MSINIKNFTAKFKNNLNPKVGLIALSTDQTIEGDFNNICKNLPLDIFINTYTCGANVNCQNASFTTIYFL